MNNTAQLITVSGLDTARLSATEEARQRRDSLVSAARSAPAITDTATADHSARALVQLKNYSREIEAARKDVKTPIIDLGRKIDALAAELTGTVETEAARLSKVLGAWQAEQNRLAEEQRRKAWAAEQEIKAAAMRAEREAADRLAAEQAELAAKAARARTLEGKERAELAMQQAERRAAEEQQARIDANARELVAAQAAIATVAPKPEGVATRTEICFVVEDIIALYEAAPYLVKMDVNIVPLKAALKALTGNQRLPGVRHWTEAKSFVR